MQSVKVLLDPLVERYHRREFLSSDPLEIVHRYRDPFDQEAVALLAAVLAYGNVKQIRRSIEDALARLSRVAASPAQAIRALRSAGGEERLARELAGFVHRFNVGTDLWILFKLLSLSWERHGSLGAHLVSHLGAEDPDFGSALSATLGEWRQWEKELRHRSDTFSYLLTSPAQGSCCKRWCMLLRWMGRKDELDLGLWMAGSPLLSKSKTGLRPGQLVMPLDTHTGRIGQYLGLTRRKSLNWKAALEVTENLRLCDAHDPVKYDFAICRLGILDLCQRKFRASICKRCELVTVCKFARRRQARIREAA